MHIEEIIMLTVGNKLESFVVTGVKPGGGHPQKGELPDLFFEITEKSFEGKWKVLVYYPKDFTFVCPTEIAEFNKRSGDFSDRDTVLYGASTDSEFVHAAWRKDHDDLRDLKFPMLADTSKSLAEELGILTEGDVDEVLRVLDALQTDELCPCNWKAGDATL